MKEKVVASTTNFVEYAKNNKNIVDYTGVVTDPANFKLVRSKAGARRLVDLDESEVFDLSSL
jgi:hypothetical protein